MLRQMLKPDGVLMACFPGGETLRELRFSLMQAEIQTMGGASQRVLPFADKQQVGALMQRAGYALPVVFHPNTACVLPRYIPSDA